MHLRVPAAPVLMLRSMLIAAAFSVLTLTVPGGARAHGDLDQYLQGDAGCNPFNFPAQVTQAGGQRQEFVPSGAGLTAVGVCIGVDVPTSVNIIVRRGSAGAPGTVAGGGTIVATTLEYAHVDFPAIIPVTPGEKLVIELSASTNVTWYGTAPGVDLYPAGAPSAPGSVGDFAFRTYLGDLPPTFTPAASHTPSRTPTFTPTRTPVPSVTPLPAASSTPPPAPTQPAAVDLPPPSEPSPVPPPGNGGRTQPRSSSGSATPVAAVLGVWWTGRVYLPEVGAASGARNAPPWHAGTLALAGASIVALAVAMRAMRRTR